MARPRADGPGRDAAILAARARMLARCEPPRSPHACAVLTFSAGAERFAIALDRVLRVERLDRVTRVPRSGRGVVGLFNLHGRPCPLLDVPSLVAPDEPRSRRWAVVLGRRQPEIALAADEVEATVIDRPAAVRSGGLQLGVTPDARILLDADALMEAPDGGARRGASP